MTDQELRTLVREAIAKQLSRPPAAALEPSWHVAPIAAGGSSVSFAQFGVPSGPEGTCVIEPSVMCNHCGYCKSYGH